MDSGRLMISSGAAPFGSRGGDGGEVLFFGGGGGGGFRGGGGPMTAVAGAENGRHKRPFLTTHEELHQLELGPGITDGVDQLYGFKYAPERTKRRLTVEQVQALEVSFEEEKRKLEPERKGELARRLGISPRQVAVWFQNRRARWRTKQLETDFDRLRTAYDELLAGRDALVADNNRLRSQVTTLTEKLQAKELPATQPEEQTAPSSATDITAMREAAVLFVQLNEDQLCKSTGGAVPAQGLPGGAHSDSPESYFACAPSPPSSSEGDCGEDNALLLPDAMLLAAVEHGHGHDAEEDSWEWFWN